MEMIVECVVVFLIGMKVMGEGMSRVMVGGECLVEVFCESDEVMKMWLLEFEFGRDETVGGV